MDITSSSKGNLYTAVDRAKVRLGKQLGQESAGHAHVRPEFGHWDACKKLGIAVCSRHHSADEAERCGSNARSVGP